MKTRHELSLTLSARLALAALFCLATLAISLAPSPVRAQTAKSNLVLVAAVVQYVSGRADRVDAKRTRFPLEYKSVLYEGDRFIVGKESFLKLATRNGCVVVLHGDAQVITPTREQPWRVKAPAVRWICPKGVRESFTYRGTRIEVEAGEVLLDADRLLVLVGNVTAPGESPLAVGKLHALESGQWRKIDPEPHPYDVWTFNSNRRAPAESAAMEMPEKPSSTRWILGFQGGTGMIAYDNDSLNQPSRERSGGHLQMHRKYGDGSLLAVLHFRELHDPNRNRDNNGSPEGVNADTKLVGFELGYRRQHDAWTSPYLRLGIGVENSRINIYKPNIHGSDFEYEFYVVTVSAGWDAIYRPSLFKWLGLYGALEASGSQSLGRGAKRKTSSFGGWSSSPNADVANEPWRLTTISLQLMLGGFLQF